MARKFGGDIMKTLAVRIVGCWNKVSVQVIKSLIISFQEYDFKIWWSFFSEKMNSQVSWDPPRSFTLHVFLPFLTLVFFTELALQRYSENVSSDNHTVIFREQQRQVCSLTEGLLEAKMTRAQAVLHHGVWPECGEPGAGLLKTEFLNRPRQGKGRNQAWGPSRGPGQSGAAEDRTGNRATTDIQGPSRKKD